ncbi:hypothetical protein B0T24DRAFT_235462 [Lasiosphaeria ovina]|uniref:Fungal N-terminal domain-containing protein n=1 Tax=Lasiosphaeria ovina TaxID=92902 RepID=A0AAE0NAT5_9PEZI|nr:hypothetical protein B0T24DRAFT_235462 [Lasiosphaeria ovina]
MDPLSIVVSSASLAAFCGKVSILIYDFVDGTANVDDNLAGMKREVEGLGRVLDAIGHSKVGSSDIEAASRDSGRELVSSLHESLWDCRGSLEKLAEALASVNKPRSLLWSSRPGRQIRLSLKAKDIAQYRQQIKSHTQDMQLSLGVISLCLQLKDRANSDGILQSLHNLEAQIGGAGRARPGTHRKQLVDAAESICSNASVIVGRSTTSSHYNPSIHGERLSEAKKEGILGWIPPPISEDTESFDRSRTAVDDGDEADIDNEFLQKLKQLALNSFSAGKYDAAATYLSKLISSGGAEDTAARLMLAISQASIGKWQEVDQSVLLPEACPSYDPVAVHHYFHLLHAAALHHLAQEEATTALEFCRRAVKGKKTFFGKSTDSYNYSLALLSAISISLGDKVSGEVYREMLPTGKVYELFFEAPGMAIQKYIHWALNSGRFPEGEAPGPRDEDADLPGALPKGKGLMSSDDDEIPNPEVSARLAVPVVEHVEDNLEPEASIQPLELVPVLRSAEHQTGPDIQLHPPLSVLHNVDHQTGPKVIIGLALSATQTFAAFTVVDGSGKFTKARRFELWPQFEKPGVLAESSAVTNQYSLTSGRRKTSMMWGNLYPGQVTGSPIQPLSLSCFRELYFQRGLSSEYSKYCGMLRLFVATVKEFVHKKVCAMEGLKGHVPCESYLVWPFELRGMGQGVQEAYKELLKGIPNTASMSPHSAEYADLNYSRCFDLRKGSHILSLMFDTGIASAKVFRVVGIRPFSVEQIDHTRALAFGELILQDAKKRDQSSTKGSDSEPEYYDIKLPLHSPDPVDNSTHIECDIGEVKSFQPANELRQIFQFLNNIVRLLPGTTEAPNVIHFFWSSFLHYPIQKHVHRYIHQMQAAGLNARLVSEPSIARKLFNVPGMAEYAFITLHCNVPPPPKPTASDELTARWMSAATAGMGKSSLPQPHRRLRWGLIL